MDPALLLILFLVRNPEIATVEELQKNLQETFGDDCHWSINDLGLELNAMTEAEILDKNGKVTVKGLKFLAEDKIFNYIKESLPSSEELLEKTLFMILHKDRGVTEEFIQKKINEIFGEDFFLQYPLSFYLEPPPDGIKKEKSLYFLV